MSTFVCQFPTGAIVILINEGSWQLHTVHKAPFFFFWKKKAPERTALHPLMADRCLWSWNSQSGVETFAKIWVLAQFPPERSLLSQYSHLLFLVFCHLCISTYPICIVSEWKVSHPCSPCWKCLPGPPSPPLQLLVSLLTLQFNFFSMLQSSLFFHTKKLNIHAIKPSRKWMLY